MSEQQHEQPATPAPAPAPAPAPGMATRSEKEVGIAYLLWLFLGLVGAHKFYLGRVGMGLAYFLTLGFLGIGVLIDLFTLPSQVRRENAIRRTGL